ncbi:MAG: hypothetical protein DRP50_07050 [Thermotoga sp.]|nr:MAG: hypothetical protein DRP50_07050 [Thermotoga sp.]
MKDEFTCGIVEDEPLPLKRLVRILEGYGVEISFTASSFETAQKLINTEKPDVLFLDINLGEQNAFELLKGIKYEPTVVFVTAYDEYAIKAFEENAIDYILKPYSKERIEKCLNRLRKKNTPVNSDLIELLENLRSRKERIRARDGEDIVLLNPDEIIYAKAEEKRVYIVTDFGKFTYESSLNDLQKYYLRTNFTGYTKTT